MVDERERNSVQVALDAIESDIAALAGRCISTSYHHVQCPPLQKDLLKGKDCYREPVQQESS